MPAFDEERFARQLGEVPLHKHLGIRFVEGHEDGITVECPIEDFLLNSHHVVHGGLTATLVDMAMGMSLWRHVEGARQMSTIELKLNYLRPLTTGTARARCYLIRVGRSIAVGRVDVTDHEGRLAATGLATYMLLDKQAPQAP